MGHERQYLWSVRPIEIWSIITNQLDRLEHFYVDTVYKDFKPLYTVITHVKINFHLYTLLLDEGDLHDNLHERDEAFVCNTECFNELLTRLSLPDLSSNLRAAECRVLHDFSLSFMYSALCSNILVDSASHRKFRHFVSNGIVFALVISLCPRYFSGI